MTASLAAPSPSGLGAFSAALAIEGNGFIAAFMAAIRRPPATIQFLRVA